MLLQVYSPCRYMWRPDGNVKAFSSIALLPYVLRQGLSVNLELTLLARLAGQ